MKYNILRLHNTKQELRASQEGDALQNVYGIMNQNGRHCNASIKKTTEGVSTTALQNVRTIKKPTPFDKNRVLICGICDILKYQRCFEYLVFEIGMGINTAIIIKNPPIVEKTYPR